MLFPFALTLLPLTQGIERVGATSFWPEYEKWDYKQECQIDTRAFTGFRLLEVLEIDFPSRELLRKDVVLLSCNQGVPRFDVKLDPNFVFNTSIEVPTEDSTFRLARRDIYTNYKPPAFYNDSMVGAVYIKKAHEWEPISPLISEFLSTSARHYGFNNRTVKATIVKKVLRSPEPLDKMYPKNDEWKKHVSPYE